MTARTHRMRGVPWAPLWLAAGLGTALLVGGGRVTTIAGTILLPTGLYATAFARARRQRGSQPWWITSRWASLAPLVFAVAFFPRLPQSGQWLPATGEMLLVPSGLMAVWIAGSRAGVWANRVRHLMSDLVFGATGWAGIAFGSAVAFALVLPEHRVATIVVGAAAGVCTGLVRAPLPAGGMATLAAATRRAGWWRALGRPWRAVARVFNGALWHARWAILCGIVSLLVARNSPVASGLAAFMLAIGVAVLGFAYGRDMQEDEPRWVRGPWIRYVPGAIALVAGPLLLSESGLGVSLEGCW